MVGKRATKANKVSQESTYIRKDVEDRPQQDRKYRFRDQQNLDLDDQRRLKFKNLLLENVENSSLEDFRKDDNEVKGSSLLLPNQDVLY